MAMDTTDKEQYFAIGDVIGSIVGLVTFAEIYIAAVNSAGWVVGLALGWVAATIGALIAYVLVRILWLPAILLLCLAYLNR